MKTLCFSCMTESFENNVCSNCRSTTNEFEQAPHLLKAGTLLNNKYIVGKVIGEGGFGITYLGFDKSLGLKVAIKEYYPQNFATRTVTANNTVYPLSGDKGEMFEYSKKKFVEEARRLAKFIGLPGIVSVKDYFEENATAYIVMEYIEGSTLKHTLSQMGGRMPETHVLEIMKPLIKSLAEIHKTGIIHRDIKPDNIMIQYPDGNIRLIDFGAAREVENSGLNTVAVASHGYAPEEQYDTNRDRNGPWTDVYSLCATIFYAIQGTPPPNAYDRLRGDEFIGFTVPVSPSTKFAVEKGLALFAKDRWKSMAKFSAALYPQTNVVCNQPQSQINIIPDNSNTVPVQGTIQGQPQNSTPNSNNVGRGYVSPYAPVSVKKIRTYLLLLE